MRVISSCRNYERRRVGRRETARADGWRECESRTLCMRVYFIYFTTAFRGRAISQGAQGAQGAFKGGLDAARFSLTNNTPSRRKNANLTATGIAGDYARRERERERERPGIERDAPRRHAFPSIIVANRKRALIRKDAERCAVASFSPGFPSARAV